MTNTIYDFCNARALFKKWINDSISQGCSGSVKLNVKDVAWNSQRNKLNERKLTHKFNALSLGWVSRRKLDSFRHREWIIINRRSKLRIRIAKRLTCPRTSCERAHVLNWCDAQFAHSICSGHFTLPFTMSNGSSLQPYTALRGWRNKNSFSVLSSISPTPKWEH